MNETTETTEAPYVFAGFGTPHFTQTPDVFFDELAPRLTESELRVCIYIIRRTFGFKKDRDRISLRQMVGGITTRDGEVLDVGTGMSKAGVVRGVQGLVKKGVIVAERNSSPTKGDEPTTYRLRFEGEDDAESTPRVNQRDTPVSTRETPPGQPSGHPRVYERDPQDTVLQHTEEQGSFEASKASPTTVVVDKIGYNPPLRYRRKRADLPAEVMIPLTRLMEDLSRDLNDQDHVTSNISRAANLYDQYATGVDAFFVTAYEARTFARHQVNARSRMALFFSALERALKGEETADVV